MIKRIITATIGIPILLSIWFASNFWYEIPFLILALTVGLIINFEIFSIVRHKERFNYPYFIMGLLITLSVFLSYLISMNMIEFNYFIIIHFLLFMFFFYYTISREMLKAYQFSENFEHFGFLCLVYTTLVLLYPQVFLLKTIQINSWALILLFTFCWINDAAGLFVGMKFGKHTLSNLPSKSKTLEGYIGAIVISLVLGIIFYNIQGFIHLPFQWTLLKWVYFSIAISFSTHFGDLAESLIKRWGESKDSGTALPGLGGFFDTIDGQIYSIPICLLFFYF